LQATGIESNFVARLTREIYRFKMLVLKRGRCIKIDVIGLMKSKRLLLLAGWSVYLR
jgi:hypothetical protein